MSRLREAMDAVRASPKNAAAWVTLGELLAADGQHEKATQSFQRALQLEPTNAAAQRGLAQLLLAGDGGGIPDVETETPSSSELAMPRPTAQSMRALPPNPPAVRETPGTAPAEESPPATREPTPLLREDAPPRRGGARTYDSAPELRTPPSPPAKPSQERMIIGLIALLAIPLLCLCVLFLAFAWAI